MNPGRFETFLVVASGLLWLLMVGLAGAVLVLDQCLAEAGPVADVHPPHAQGDGADAELVVPRRRFHDRVVDAGLGQLRVHRFEHGLLGRLALGDLRLGRGALAAPRGNNRAAPLQDTSTRDLGPEGIEFARQLPKDERQGLERNARHC